MELKFPIMPQHLLTDAPPVHIGYSRYLELDHNTPRSDGGINHLSNRILLCGQCNRLKSNALTLSGLGRENKKLGYMA